METLILPDEYKKEAKYFLELDEQHRDWEEGNRRREKKEIIESWYREEQRRPLHERVEDEITLLTPPIGAKLEEWEVDL